MQSIAYEYGNYPKLMRCLLKGMAFYEQVFGLLHALYSAAPAREG
jgi:hypothetical protein